MLADFLCDNAGSVQHGTGRAFTDNLGLLRCRFYSVIIMLGNRVHLHYFFLGFIKKAIKILLKYR